MNTTRGLLRSVGIDSALHPRFEGTPRGRAALLVANLVFLTNGADLFAASSIVKFSTDTYSATERSRAALVLLVRTNIVDAVAGVTLRTTDQAAIGGQDYLRVVTNIVFDVGETYRTVSIPLSMDGLPEGVETFKVGLSDPLEGTVLRSGSSAAVQIIDTGSFEFEWNRYWAAENEGSVDVEIRRNADNDAPSAVDVRTFDVSARSGLDYEGFTNRVFFAAGERFKRVPVRILQDTAKEGAEHFTLALGNPTAGSSIDRSGEYARVQVLDDNPTVHFATDAAWVHEAAGSLVVRVERGGGPSRPPFSVGYATKALTATPGADYGERSGTIVFAEGESLGSFTVPILPDTEIEEDEQFLIELNHVEGEAVLGTPASIAMRITIVDASGESPHRFENVRVDPSGNWRLSLAGQAHARFEGFLDLFPLEQSSNLVDWSSLGMLSATNLSGSPLDYLQPAPGRESPRFLRTPTRHFLTPAAPPTGPHAVGRMDRWVTDPGRGNRFGVSTNHSFQVALWYPATARAGAWPLPCFDEAVLRDTSFSGTNWMDRMPYLVEYGAEGLDLAPGEQRLPIVLISAGGGGVRQDLWEKADELASHGYFVMAPDHIDAWGVVLPDGRYSTRTRDTEDWAATEDRVLDLVFLVDQLERWSVEDSMFRDRLDLGRIAVLGFSRGGQSATAFGQREPRCRAAVILDASLVGTTVQFGLQKPSLSIQSPGRDDRQLFNSAARDAYFLRIQGASHVAIGGWAFYPTADASTLRLTHEINRSVNAYTVWFLNRYLREFPDPMPPITDHPLVLGLLLK